MGRTLLLGLPLLLAGCAVGGADVELNAYDYQVGGSREICCTSGGGFYNDLECPDGRVHWVSVSFNPLPERDVAADRWRLVWDDDHRTGVSVAYIDEGPHRRMQGSLGACPPTGAQVVGFVELQDAEGKRIGRSAIPVLGD